jgi:TonB-linked SusC/RagA family outer membrane protein
LNYLAPLGENHRLDFLAGYSYQLTTWEGFNASNYKFLTDEFLYNNIGAGAAPRPTVGSSKSEQKWASYFGRANYAYNGKYLLSGVIRRDGSSIFAKNKKYGIFPSLSIGWLISEEPFWNENIPVGFLKLRASYGTTGNSNIGGNAFAYYSTGNNYVFNNEINSGVYMSQLNNDNLTWETAKEFNIGIDYQILKNRISGTFDYFNKTVNNLLTFRPLPTSFPVSSVADNVGKTRSVGWEVGIESRNFVSNSGGFEWNTQITISHYKDTWVERSPQALAVLAKYIDPKGPFNPIYRYRNDGMYTKDRQAPSWMPGIIQGTVILKDFNGYDENGQLTGEPDGQITDADYVLVGVWDPKITFGFSNNLSYKNFSLSIYMYGAVQKKDNGVLSNANGAESSLAQFGQNGSLYYKERWSYNNQTAKIPSGLSNKYASQLGSSDFYLKDASFLRCQDLTLAYSIPSNIIQKQNALSGLRLSFGIQNAFVLSKFQDLDPELANWMSYPNPRSFIFGLNASF